MEDAPPDKIICATYTHARRHPLVLGHIAGWTPPFQLSLPQLGVLVVVVLVEMKTWRLWGPLLPRSVAVMVAVGLPCGLAWAVRRARAEGRSLARTVLGWVMLLSTPRAGRVGGRPYQPARAADLRKALVFVAAGDDGA
jgi:hypothetical protein